MRPRSRRQALRGWAVAFGLALALPAAAQEFEGRLGEGSPVLATDGTYYRMHEFEARDGEELVIDLMSSDFDAFLFVHSPTGEIYHDDDGGAGLDSRLTITANATGTWRAFANTVERGESGRYRLTVQRVDAAQFETRNFTGRLHAGSQRLPTSGAFYHEHTIELEAGQQVTIDLMSEAFDALLHVHSPSGQVFTDDDGGAGTDSRLVLTTDRAGVWRMVATSFRAGEQGEYRLTVRIPRR